MSKLAAEFGISDRGLAKICRRYNVPTPPRGHWAKLAAGKASPKVLLPKHEAEAGRIAIQRTPEPSIKEQAIRAAERQQEVKAQGHATGSISIPETLRRAHPVVTRWIDAHRAEQEKSRREARNRKLRTWRAPRTREDLTERDRYRLRVTSAFLREIERQGAVVEKGEPNGRIETKIDGEPVACVIVEKMTRSYGAMDKTWTAWPEHHNAALKPTGFLRLTAEARWGVRKDLIETSSVMADRLLPRFVGIIMAMGPILLQSRKEEEERKRLYEKKQAEHAERVFLKREDDDRWERVRAAASNHEECRLLRNFIDALRAQAPKDRAEIDGRSFDNWIAWAEARLEAMDPLKEPKEIFRLPRLGNRY